MGGSRRLLKALSQESFTKSTSPWWVEPPKIELQDATGWKPKGDGIIITIGGYKAEQWELSPPDTTKRLLYTNALPGCLLCDTCPPALLAEDEAECFSWAPKEEEHFFRHRCYRIP